MKNVEVTDLGLEYRESNYFNENDTYLFETHGILKEGKANFEKGFWWMNNYYKATTVKCVIAKSE
jgi:hypothetical protein